uniref:Uncharacterized protein n=1 Tax=Melicertus latisulcatus majanivirus TaxID=2984277 RepID=A0A9C7CDA4_9VIRU|nr:MAG: hypothetical protein [Melicertus latisulcatus majanivirus]
MNPDTLKSISLRSIVEYTLRTVYAIEREERRLVKHEPVIVDELEFHENTKSMISEARIILTNTPLTFIDDYMELVIKEFCTDIFHSPNEPSFMNVRYAILLDIIPVNRMSTFSDDWIDSRWRSLWVELFYKKWAECSNPDELKLKKLSLSATPMTSMGSSNFYKMFENFTHLTSLKIIRELWQYENSFFNHIIRPISQYCRELRELHLAYDGEALKNTSLKIEDLVECRNLVSLWLYDQSPMTAVKSVDGLQKLLIELKNLKCLYHKNLKSAILDLNEKISGTLGLEHLILRDNNQDVEVVLTTDELVRLSKICPATRTLKLIKPPPCIDTVARVLPNLEILDMSECDADLLSSLSRALFQKNLKNLEVLKLRGVFNLNYTHISQLAQHCPNLEVLDISFATIKADGDLTLPPRQSSAFPHLKKLTMVPKCDMIGPWHICYIGNNGGCRYSMWEVGEKLTRYLLKGSYNLESLHIHYCNSYYKPSSSFVPEMLESLNNLTSLQLVSFLDMPCEFIYKIATYCPKLNKLAALGSWGKCNMAHYEKLPVHIELESRCEC